MEKLQDWMANEGSHLTSECPFCNETFKPRFYPPKKGGADGCWQRFCSKTCRKLWYEEQKENAW